MAEKKTSVSNLYIVQLLWVKIGSAANHSNKYANYWALYKVLLCTLVIFGYANVYKVSIAHKGT